MTGFQIAGDWENELREFAAGLALVPNGLETAVVRAINKTLQGGRTDAVNLLRRDYNMKASEIRKEIKITRARQGYPEGSLHGAGSPGIPLFQFGVRPKRAPSTRRLKSGAYRPVGGISVQVRKSTGRKVVKGAFVARMASGHTGVFQRDGRRRLPIEELFGPSPIKVLASDRYDEEMETRIDERMQKNLKHETENVLRQAGVRW